MVTIDEMMIEHLISEAAFWVYARLYGKAQYLSLG